MAGFNNFYNPGYSQPMYSYPRSPYEPIYVTGIEGANAFQMPQGVQQMILWDTDTDSFYIKKLDEMGRPRVVAWKDFTEHVMPQPAEQPTAQDMSVYPTKKDLEDMLNQYDMTQYLTKKDFSDMLNRLYVGERGRIVLSELDQ